MSKMSDFYSAAINDNTSRKKLAEILDGKSFEEATDEQLVQIGELSKSLGIEIDIDEAKAFLRGNDQELDEDDLDAVAGGKGDKSTVELYRGDELKFQCFGSNGGSV